MVDVAGGRVVPEQTVVVCDARISVGRAEGKVIDGSGKFLIPGLWDAHVHLRWKGEGSLEELVASGDPALRDLGGHLDELDAWRSEIEVGTRVGSRIRPRRAHHERARATTSTSG